MEESRLKDLPSVDESKLTERRMEFVHAEEDKIREMTWEILREAMEGFADEVIKRSSSHTKLMWGLG